MSKHKACSNCLEARGNHDWERAMSCHSCNGTGILLTRVPTVCNMCSGSMSPAEGPNKEYDHGLVNCVVTGSYDSYHIFDLTNYKFSICELCLRNMFNSFEIPPSVEDSHDGEESYEEDLKAYQNRLWKDAGGFQRNFENGICNDDKDCLNKAEWRELNMFQLTDNIYCNDHINNMPDCDLAFLSFDKANGIHSINEEQSLEDKKILCNLILDSLSGKDLYHFRYLPECFNDVVGFVENESNILGGVYFPAEGSPFSFNYYRAAFDTVAFVRFKKMEFNCGILYYGPSDGLKNQLKTISLKKV